MKDLIVTGDSWTFGSEIIDPSLNPDIYEWELENGDYRKKHIFPTLLSERLNLNFRKNLAFPGDSNDKIFRSLYNYLLKYYIKDSKLVHNVFLLVQLSSYDRLEFYYRSKENVVGEWKTIWPNWEHDYLDFNYNRFADTYSKFIESPQGNLNRYLNQIFSFQNFCKTYKIPYLIVQGFYHTGYAPNILDWHDNAFINHYDSSNYLRTENNTTEYFQGSSEPEIWNEIDSIRFMNKDLENHSLHSILKEKNDSSLFYDVHPSEKGHEVIAEYIENYIKKYKLLSFN
jgi:hypothetical protein